MTNFLSALVALFVFDGFILPWIWQHVKYTCGILDYVTMQRKTAGNSDGFSLNFLFQLHGNRASEMEISRIHTARK